MASVALPDGVAVQARSLGASRHRQQPSFGVYLCGRRSRRRVARGWTGTWRDDLAGLAAARSAGGQLGHGRRTGRGARPGRPRRAGRDRLHQRAQPHRNRARRSRGADRAGHRRGGGLGARGLPAGPDRHPPPAPLAGGVGGRAASSGTRLRPARLQQPAEAAEPARVGELGRLAGPRQCAQVAGRVGAAQVVRRADHGVRRAQLQRRALGRSAASRSRRRRIAGRGAGVQRDVAGDVADAVGHRRRPGARRGSRSRLPAGGRSARGRGVVDRDGQPVAERPTAAAHASSRGRPISARSPTSASGHQRRQPRRRRRRPACAPSCSAPVAGSTSTSRQPSSVSSTTSTGTSSSHSLATSSADGALGNLARHDDVGRQGRAAGRQVDADQLERRVERVQGDEQLAAAGADVDDGGADRRRGPGDRTASAKSGLACTDVRKCCAGAWRAEEAARRRRARARSPRATSSTPRRRSSPMPAGRRVGAVRYPREDWNDICDASPSVDDRPARLSVGVVGAGRVGAVLGAALAQAGHRVVGRVGGRPTPPAAGPTSCCPAYAGARRRRRCWPPPSWSLLTVPDDVLPGLVEGLAATGAIAPGQLLVHTSGRYGVAVLDPATRAGALPLALHPAMTFTGTARGPGPAGRLLLRRHRAGAAAADRRGAGRRDGRRARSGSPRRPRPLYHAALADGAEPPRHAGRRGGGPAARGRGRASRRGCSAPLLGAALDNALRSGDAALTGPVARGDAGTVAAHVSELRERVAGHAPRPTSRWPG